MTLLGLLIVIIPVVIIIAGFAVLNYSKNRTPVDVSTKIFIMLLSLATGTVTGFVLFIPVYFLVCVIDPIHSYNGLVGMPLGQAFFGGVISLIMGIVITIVVYIKTLRWQICKHGLLK